MSRARDLSNFSSQSLGIRNRIINGNFDIWQRNTSVTGIASGAFVADRWKCYRVGTTANVSRQSFTLGQTDVPYEPTYFHRVVTTSVAGAGNCYQMYQGIESVKTLAGQTGTLSFWAKADAAKNIAIEFYQSFGSGGSPSSAVTGIGVSTCALTTLWQKFEITVSIPSISGKTLGSDENDWMGAVFHLDAGSNFNARTNSLGQQSGTFDISQVQFEAGPVATTFEQRPIGQELSLCQRYYQKLTGTLYGTQGNASYSVWIFKTQMRATPTLSGNAGTIDSSTPDFAQNYILDGYASWSSSSTADAEL